jgi:hypothetical protein
VVRPFRRPPSVVVVQLAPDVVVCGETGQMRQVQSVGLRTATRVMQWAATPRPPRPNGRFSPSTTIPHRDIINRLHQPQPGGNVASRRWDLTEIQPRDSVASTSHGTSHTRTTFSFLADPCPTEEMSDSTKVTLDLGSSLTATSEGALLCGMVVMDGTQTRRQAHSGEPMTSLPPAAQPSPNPSTNSRLHFASCYFHGAS